MQLKYIEVRGPEMSNGSVGKKSTCVCLCMYIYLSMERTIVLLYTHTYTHTAPPSPHTHKMSQSSTHHCAPSQSCSKHARSPSLPFCLHGFHMTSHPGKDFNADRLGTFLGSPANWQSTWVSHSPRQMSPDSWNPVQPRSSRWASQAWSLPINFHNVCHDYLL